MLIFDRFPSEQRAKDFASAVERKFKLKTSFFMDQDESNEVDPFPFELMPPIVLVDRPVNDKGEIDFGFEEKVEKFVKKFDGTFAGT